MRPKTDAVLINDPVNWKHLFTYYSKQLDTLTDKARAIVLEKLHEWHQNLSMCGINVKRPPIE
jgi:hypothetical protein